MSTTQLIQPAIHEILEIVKVFCSEKQITHAPFTEVPFTSLAQPEWTQAHTRNRDVFQEIAESETLTDMEYYTIERMHIFFSMLAEKIFENETRAWHFICDNQTLARAILKNKLTFPDQDWDSILANTQSIFNVTQQIAGLIRQPTYFDTSFQTTEPLVCNRDWNEFLSANIGKLLNLNTKNHTLLAALDTLLAFFYELKGFTMYTLNNNINFATSSEDNLQKIKTALTLLQQPQNWNLIFENTNRIFSVLSDMSIELQFPLTFKFFESSSSDTDRDIILNLNIGQVNALILNTAHKNTNNKAYRKLRKACDSLNVFLCTLYSSALRQDKDYSELATQNLQAIETAVRDLKAQLHLQSPWPAIARIATLVESMCVNASNRASAPIKAQHPPRQWNPPTHPSDSPGETKTRGCARASWPT
jgi:hypothetical protein